MDYTFFEARPGISVLLLPDVPKFTIVTVSHDFIRTLDMKREEVIGKGLFELFPENPATPNFTGQQNISSSFKHVIHFKEPHQLPHQRYDIPNGEGNFSEKYWKTINVPVLSETGDVQFIIHTSEDITQQVLAEQSEVRLKGFEKAYDLFMQAPVAVCMVSGEEYIVELANEHMLQLLGRTAAMVGQPITASLTEAKKQGLISVLDQVRTTAKPYHIPTFPAELLINGEREKRYFDLVFQPYLQSSNDLLPTSIFCIAYNITVQIQTQKKVEESEHRFRTLIEEASVATGLYIGKELIIQYANDIMIGYWGKDNTVIGKPIAEAIPELKGQPFLNYLDHVYTTGEPYIGTEEKAYLQVDGILQPYYFNFTYKALRDKAGNIYGIHHMSINVTDQVLIKRRLEESSQELQLAIDAADLGTFRVDLLNDQATYSKRVMDWFGFTEQGISMKVVQGHVHPEDLDKVVGALEASYTTETNSRHEVSYRVVHGIEGTVRHLRSFGKTFFNANGEAYMMVGVIQDITQQMQYQQHLKDSETALQERVLARTIELEKLNEELRRSNQNLEEFAHAASHDMKEPIRKVQIFSDRLKRSLGERMNQSEIMLFERMENANRRMGLLVDDLLNFSYVSERPLEMEEVDLTKKINNVLVDLELLVEQKKAHINVEAMPKVKGYSRQLQQLFQNLIGNALKYSKANVVPGITITAHKVQGHEIVTRILMEQRDQSFYLIKVSDNGIGFEQAYAERIFSMFQRLHGKSEYEGTGVGLSIARKVVENHHGYIWADSEPGVGSTFSILLPIN